MMKKKGQAMVELLCGLVSIIILVAALAQVGLISYAHTGVVVESRQKMAEAMVNSSMSASADGYLADWDDGADGQAYTADDEEDYGNASPFLGVLAWNMKLEEMEAVSQADGNKLTDLQYVGSSSVPDHFDIMRAEAVDEPISIFPLLRRLLFLNDEIEIEHRVYMPLRNGILPVIEEGE
jgi:hypothetical protein